MSLTVLKSQKLNQVLVWVVSGWVLLGIVMLLHILGVITEDDTLLRIPGTLTLVLTAGLILGVGIFGGVSFLAFRSSEVSTEEQFQKLKWTLLAFWFVPFLIGIVILRLPLSLFLPH